MGSTRHSQGGRRGREGLWLKVEVEKIKSHHRDEQGLQKKNKKPHYAPALMTTEVDVMVELAVILESVTVSIWKLRCLFGS